jgi:hypothetical protein
MLYAFLLPSFPCPMFAPSLPCRLAVTDNALLDMVNSDLLFSEQVAQHVCP